MAPQTIAPVLDALIWAGTAASVFVTVVLWFSNSFLDIEAGIARGTATRTAWLGAVNRKLDAIYGPDLLGGRAYAVSAATSLGLVALGYAAIWIRLSDGLDRLAGNPGFLGTLTIAACVNVVPDLLSLVQTRWLLRRHATGAAPQGVLLLVALDLVISLAISLASIWLFCWWIDYPRPALAELVGLWSIFSICFYSTFLGSALMLAMGVGALAIRLRGAALDRGVPLTADPLRQFAWAGGAVVLVAGFALALGAGMLLRGGPDDLPAPCRLFPGDLCAHQARFESDPARRLALNHAGCAADDPLACAGLGMMYAAGEGVVADPAAARDLLARSCSQHVRDGCFGLASLLERENGPGADLDRSETLFRAECARGVQRACERLAWRLLARADAGAPDEAIDLLQGACAAGEAGACLAEARLIQAGWLDAPDAARARRLARDGCEAERPDACLELGILLERAGRDTRPEAAAMALRACAAGLPTGCTRHALWVDWSGLAPLDRLDAMRALRAACAQGGAQACPAADIAMLGRPDLPREAVEAVHQRILDACRDGDPGACLAIGELAGRSGEAAPSFRGYAEACLGGLEEACRSAALAWIRLDVDGDAAATPERLAHIVAASCAGPRPRRCLLADAPDAPPGLGAHLTARLDETVGPAVSGILFRDAMRAYPADIPLALSAAIHVLRHDDPDTAGDMVATLIERAPHEGAAHALLARLRMARDAPADEIRALLRDGRAADPADPALLFVSGLFHEGQGEMRAAIDAYRHLLDQGASGVGTINNFVSLVTSYSDDPADLDRALMLADRLADRDDWATRETHAWALALGGAPALAADILQELAGDARAQDPLFRAHLGLALHWSGAEDRARAHLRAAEAGLDRPWQAVPRHMVAAALAGDD